LSQAGAELGRFGLRPDQAEESEIPAPQDALDDLEIERVAVRHHEVVRAARRFVDHPGGFFLDHDADILIY